MVMIFPFGGLKQAGSAQRVEGTPPPDPALLGRKGANLARMAQMGLPVPPGFTISTAGWARFVAGGGLDDDLRDQIGQGLAYIEAATGRRFGDPANPLLLSVRSGAAASMPGMMDTVLNIGLNDSTADGLARQTGQSGFAWDCYRRLIAMYGDVVLGLGHHRFEDALEILKEDRGYFSDGELEAGDWQALAREFAQIVEQEQGSPFPQDVKSQLLAAIGAVFASWDSERARIYRRLHDIADDGGTAVTVQAMVFGNRCAQSATGVAFTRDPATGERALFGEWLAMAQGEDLVSGLRTPHYLSLAARQKAGARAPSLEEAMPPIYAELAGLLGQLEAAMGDMQDIEFTIEQGKLWLLQTRSGKRTARAGLKIAVDMVAEGLISTATALARIEPAGLDQLLHPQLDRSAACEVLTRGLPASPGAASGVIALDVEAALGFADRGEPVILVRSETSPEDIAGIHAAQGVVTLRGGMTSHAAVVTRGMGRPCITAASAMRIDLLARCLTIGTRQLREGELITMDGASGEIMAGAVPMLEPELGGDFGQLMGWADAARRMETWANADNAEDIARARRFGAQGIGLCRTEPMFFEKKRLAIMRQMILAENETSRHAALARLSPFQRADFHALLRAADGMPLAVRLLDLPLHEVMPKGEQELADTAAQLEIGVETLRRRVRDRLEVNPILGLRGCRLGIAYPEIYAMQIEALFEAVCDVIGEGGAPRPEILVPLVSSGREMAMMKELVQGCARKVQARRLVEFSYRLGAMIELPRAALMAQQIAGHCDFFTFGTNDLTQTTLGMSREDAGFLLHTYMQGGVFRRDPFASLDQGGVGALVQMAARDGRSAGPNIALGVCGDHASDPASIRFFAESGLDYISVPAKKLPLARLAAAQAGLFSPTT